MSQWRVRSVVMIFFFCPVMLKVRRPSAPNWLLEETVHPWAVTLSHPSQKYISTRSAIAHFTAPCGRHHAFLWRNTRTVSNISACDRQRVFTATRQCRREFYTSDPVSVLDNCLGSGRCRRSSELARASSFDRERLITWRNRAPMSQWRVMWVL